MTGFRSHPMLVVAPDARGAVAGGSRTPVARARPLDDRVYVRVLTALQSPVRQRRLQRRYPFCQGGEAVMAWSWPLSFPHDPTWVRGRWVPGGGHGIRRELATGGTHDDVGRSPSARR